MKEHGRTDLVAPLALALRHGLARLFAWGMVDRPMTLVPAPTRRSAARCRGGDPVTRIATAANAGHPDVVVARALRMQALVRDSVGLSSTARQRNVAGRVRLQIRVAGDVVLIDDIVTTGATAAESVRILQPVMRVWWLYWRLLMRDAGGNFPRVKRG